MKAPARFAKPLAISALAASLIAAASVAHAAETAAPNTPASPNGAMVLVAKATNACFSDMVRVTGFIVPRREALVGVETEGSKVSEVLVREGDNVTENQELARLIPPSAPGNARPGPVTLRAPAAGLITAVNTIAGAPASPQAGPMFRIAINNDIELDAEVPSIHILKLNPGATARISRDDQPDVIGKVRLVSPQIDRVTQLGHVRLSFASNPGLKVGMFARASIDAKRSCGVAIPKSAIDHLTVQVVKGNTIETRRVKVGLTSDTSIEVLEGVDAGDVVVADAGTSLHDGDQVRTMFAEELDRSRVR
ncbi:MAG: efflux transporter periplasmic adaptor subunit [Tardiphaga sp.]|jgi:multidrug efflux pump subunit AcrA (membrane-fusion protein)|nr:efflux transporter periplasmic adaptor subunit [Tardiphaga sp.]